MSLYNLVNGHSVGFLLVMPMLGRKSDEYPRFRDCFFGKADKDGGNSTLVWWEFTWFVDERKAKQ